MKERKKKKRKKNKKEKKEKRKYQTYWSTVFGNCVRNRLGVKSFTYGIPQATVARQISHLKSHPYILNRPQTIKLKQRFTTPVILFDTMVRKPGLGPLIRLGSCPSEVPCRRPHPKKISVTDVKSEIRCMGDTHLNAKYTYNTYIYK